jgi:hypothetical protein
MSVLYNVLDGGRGRESLVLEVVRAASPDVIVLQEVFDEMFVRLLAAPRDALLRGARQFERANRDRQPVVL